MGNNQCTTYCKFQSHNQNQIVTISQNLKNLEQSKISKFNKKMEDNHKNAQNIKSDEISSSSTIKTKKIEKKSVLINDQKENVNLKVEKISHTINQNSIKLQKEKLYGQLGTQVNHFLTNLYYHIVNNHILQVSQQLQIKINNNQSKIKNQVKRQIDMRASSSSTNSSHRIKKQNFIRILRQNINNRYTFLEKLGEGAYGCVFKGICNFTKQYRAIKIIKKKNIKNCENILFSQLEILKTLDHPNIIKLYQVYDYFDFYYVVTQYCEGGQLFQTVKKNQKFTEKYAALLMKQILSAIKYLHSKNIVHRDLKPQNIVLQYKKTKDNIKDPPIKIIDFGTAKYFKKDQIIIKKVGSPYYVAPEVLKQNYNEKCDIWSCGIIMYVLLIGSPPFKGKSQKQIFQNISKARIPVQGKNWKKISQKAKKLIQAMLDRNVSRRITAQQALNHPWILQSQEIETIHQDVLDNLSNFFYQNKFIAVLQTFLATNMISQKQRRQLAEKFKQIDKDNSGYIQLNQLLEAYKQVYGFSDAQHIQQIINKIDTTGTGKINFTEFMLANYNHNKLFQQKSIQMAFDFFDKDHTGYIQIQELKDLLTGSNDEEVKNIMNELDTNGDNKISKEQFKNKLLNIQNEQNLN